jgi:hypothetical protein
MAVEVADSDHRGGNVEDNVLAEKKLFHVIAQVIEIRRIWLRKNETLVTASDRSDVVAELEKVGIEKKSERAAPVRRHHGGKLSQTFEARNAFRRTARTLSHQTQSIRVPNQACERRNMDSIEQEMQITETMSETERVDVISDLIDSGHRKSWVVTARIPEKVRKLFEFSLVSDH